MTRPVCERRFRRRGRRALRRMTERQRAIFTAMRFEGASYQDLAERHGLSVEEVQRELACALLWLSRAVHGRWWQRWWPW